jgi:uncharacterized protein
MRRSLLAALCCGAALTSPLAAQEAVPPSEVAAARELLQVSGTREGFIRGLELGMEQGGMQLTPKLRSVVRDFMAEHFKYEDMEPDFIRVYTDLMTEDEIRALTAFYRTPIGQRLVQLMPDMAAATHRITNARLQSVMPQLIQRVTEALAEESATPTP